MKRLYTLLSIALVIALTTLLNVNFQNIEAQDDQLVIYMQMGGTEGDATTLARTTGARAAAEDLGIELHEQYSSWDTETMLEQFREAIDAKPDGIVIMGHPGEDAMRPLVEEAFEAGIIVTSGNNPLPRLELEFQPMGFGYAGADLYTGGYLTGREMIAAGLQPGDKAVVYDIWHQAGRSASSQGLHDALVDAGLEVEKLDMTNEIDVNSELAIPVLVEYLENNPDTRAIGTQHGNITAILPTVLKEAGKEPGEVITGGIDLSQATIEGIYDGYISASFDQVLYLQGYYPVHQIWLTANYLIPGVHNNTGIGMVTPDNIDQIAPLIEAGYR